MKRISKLILILTTVLCLTAIIFTVSVQSSAATSISKATVSAIKTQVYTGKAISPAVTVKYGSKTLKKGTNYTVAYKNNINVGTASVTISGKGSYSGKKTVSFNIVSPAVKGLAFTNIKQTSVTLTWNASAKATGYQVWRYDTASKAYKLVKATSAKSLTVTGLTAGSTTTLRVRPYTKLSNGKYAYGSYASIKVMTVPATVTGTVQTAAKSTTATFSWTACTGAAGYQVFFYNSATKKNTLATTIKTNKVTLTKLAPATSTYIKVRAYRTVNGKNCYSTLSAAAQLKTLPATDVTDPTADAITDSSVTLKWTAVEGASLYRVYQLKNNKWTAIALVTTNSKTVSGLSENTKYSFRVVTCVKSGSKYFNGAVKTTLDVTTATKAPPVIAVTGVTLESKAVPANVGQSLTLTATVAPENATNKAVTWSSSNTAIVTVNNGVITALKNGKAVITVKTVDGGKTATCTVTVTTPTVKVTSLTLDKAFAELKIGDSLTLVATVEPAAASQAVTWSSNNTAVATISNTGVVTAVSVGTSTIIAKSADGEKVAGCNITVKSSLPDVSTASKLLNEFSLRLNKIKSTDCPAFTSTESVSITNVKLKKPNLIVSQETFASMFTDFANDETVKMAAVTNPTQYSAAKREYWKALPVKGSEYSVKSGLDTNTIEMSKSGIKDNGNTYNLTITLKAESFASLPTRDNNSSHDKMFDILYKSYIDDTLDAINKSEIEGIKMTIGYNSFATKYHDSSVTITVDKATDKVIKAVYDMNVSVNIGKLQMKASLSGIPATLVNSDASLETNAHYDIVFTY